MGVISWRVGNVYAFDCEFICFDTRNEWFPCLCDSLFDDLFSVSDKPLVRSRRAKVSTARGNELPRATVMQYQSSLSVLYKYANVLRLGISLRQLRPLHEKPIGNPNQYPPRQTQCRYPCKTLHINNSNILDSKELPSIIPTNSARYPWN